MSKLQPAPPPPVAATAGIWGPWIVLAIGLASYAAFNLGAAQWRGLWYDELATLYFASPTAPASYFLSDTHPPLYYLLVRAAQGLGLAAQPALWAVNLLATVLFCAAAFAFLRRADHARFAVAALGAILAGPAALTFALEGRNYALAQFAAVALSAGVLSAMTRPARTRDIAVMAALAALTAATHLYGALFAGSIGAALTVVSLIAKDRTSTILGLVIGAAATAVTAGWLAVAAPVLFGDVSLVSWIPNTVGYTIGQFWLFNKMLSGAGWNAGFLALGLASCFLVRSARPYVLLLGGTALLFAALPTLASIHVPMLAGRYLGVAAPSLLLLALYAAWQAAKVARPAGRIGAGLVILFAVIAAIAAPGVATRLTQDERLTYNVKDAKDALRGCVRPKVRVRAPYVAVVGEVDQRALGMASYARALGDPRVTLESHHGPARDVADYPCRLIGWGEHMLNFDLAAADEAALLREFGLHNAGNVRLEIRKSRWGVLILHAR